MVFGLFRKKPKRRVGFGEYIERNFGTVLETISPIVGTGAQVLKISSRSSSGEILLITQGGISGKFPKEFALRIDSDLESSSREDYNGILSAMALLADNTTGVALSAGHTISLTEQTNPLWPESNFFAFCLGHGPTVDDTYEPYKLEDDTQLAVLSAIPVTQTELTNLRRLRTPTAHHKLAKHAVNDFFDPSRAEASF